MRKKIILMIGSLVVLSTLSGILAAATQKIPRTAIETPLRYGTIENFGYDFEIDPHLAESGMSKDHINQVAEGLFAHNLGSSDMEIIPCLAAGCGTWNANTTELTVPLRENVTFHDDTAFNASAIKWNFDRLATFIEEDRTPLAEIYKPMASIYPSTPLVINETVVTGEFEVKFVLNYPFAAFLPLLCFTGSAIMSPASRSNASEFLDAWSDLLVGTGPFVHVSTTTEKTVFEAYSEYYRGTPAVQHMEWIPYEDTTTASNALLEGDIDLGDVSTDFLDEFEASPDITVGQPIKGISAVYIWMNNELIPKEHRQAISYAVDYDSIIYDLRDGKAARMISPVPEGIAYHNPNVQPATYDVTKARQILIDANLSHGLTANSTDQEWLDMADLDPIASYNYTYNYGNVFREDVGILIKANCKTIGIKIPLAGLQLVDWYMGDYFVYGNRVKLALYLDDWESDYNDPSTYIYPLLSNTSLSNVAQVNDPWLQTAMMEAMTDTNHTTRKDKYFTIQEYVGEDLMPCVLLYVGIGRSVLAKAITNWNRNPMGILDFFSCTFHGEDTFISDPLMGTSCGFEAPWEYIWPPGETYPPDESTLPEIPDYGALGFLSVGFILVGVTSVTLKHIKNPILNETPEGRYGKDFSDMMLGEDLSREFFTRGDDQTST